jgi:hypothetical protein
MQKEGMLLVVRALNCCVHYLRLWPLSAWIYIVSAHREMLFFLSAERQTRLMGAFSSSLAAFHTPLRPSRFFAPRNVPGEAFIVTCIRRSARRSIFLPCLLLPGPPMYCFFVINSVCDNVMRWHFSF